MRAQGFELGVQGLGARLRDYDLDATPRVEDADFLSGIWGLWNSGFKVFGLVTHCFVVRDLGFETVSARFRSSAGR